MAIPDRSRSHHTLLDGDGDETEHQQHGPPPPIPPSPTLTNPDMILPFDESERESSTPSPPFKQLPSLSHLQAFYGGVRQMNESDGAPGQPYSRVQKNFPRHTWLHEGQDMASRRLSDIGEEEVPSPRLGPPIGLPPSGLANSTTHGQTEEKDPGAWSSSSSTISGASDRNGSKTQNGYAASRDDGGVDLHGVNQALNAVPRGDDGGSQSNTQKKMAPVAEEGGPGDEFSSAILSSEAERILDNAKKRLTLMEGNLTKARSSVRLTPSPVPSSPSGTQSLGLGQPVGGLYRSISRSDRKASAALRPRPTYGSSQDSSNNRHSRVYSDLNLSAATQPLVQSESNLSRSMSAMGSATIPEYHDERTFQYEPTRSYLTHRASVSSMQPAERPSPPIVKEEDTSDTSGLGISEDEEEGKISSVEEFNSVYPLSGPPSRTQSQMHVRDLQDQMKGLHIKISTLKVKAQEDGLRRRSFQSLRTPSPLSSTNSWYDNDMAYRGIRNMNSRMDSEAAQEAIRTDTPTIEEQAHDATEIREPATDPTKMTDVSSVVTEIDDDAHSVMESLYEDAEEGEQSDSDNEMMEEPLDETLEAFPPVPGSAEATPHEEREDAFDYEHFILHSALGNYAQARLRRQSGSSTGSDETTRPAYDRSVRQSRSNSAASQSTIASFATATEGEQLNEEDDFEGVLYWDRRFNDELRNNDQYSDSDEETADGRGTPRGQSQGKHSRNTSGSQTTNGNPPWSPASTGSATPTAFASSFVETVQASSPHPESEKSGLNNDDSRMLEQLFQSLGNVCMDLQAQRSRGEWDEKTVRMLRRRLEAARRVLEGELDT